MHNMRTSYPLPPTWINWLIPSRLQTLLLDSLPFSETIWLSLSLLIYLYIITLYYLFPYDYYIYMYIHNCIDYFYCYNSIEIVWLGYIEQRMFYTRYKGRWFLLTKLIIASLFCLTRGCLLSIVSSVNVLNTLLTVLIIVVVFTWIDIYIVMCAPKFCTTVSLSCKI